MRRPMASNETNQMLAAAASACEDKKAEDLRILALDPAESGLADYFLICNGTNDRQNVAIADEVELRLKREFNTYPNSVEGRRQGEWILLDYVDFIVHVFSPEKRAFYGLERLRKSATTLSVDELNEEIKQHIADARKKRSAKKALSATDTLRKRSSNGGAASKAGLGRGAAAKDGKVKSVAAGASKAAPAKRSAAKKAPSAKGRSR
jgi:ribosome-associated protein